MGKKEEEIIKVTIGGLAGTGTSTCGKILSKILGVEYGSGGDLFRQLAKEAGMSLADLEKLARSNPQYDRRVDDATREYGESPDRSFVFEGRLGFYFIPSSIKFFLKCAFDERTKRVSRRDNISRRAAQTLTRERERLAEERYMKSYGVDINNEGHYDLVIDTTRILPEVVLDKMVKFLRLQDS